MVPAPRAAEPGRCVPDARLGPHSLLFRYYNRNRIGRREGILEGIVEHLFLVPPRAPGAVGVVVTSFVFGSAFISISPIPRSMFRLLIQARDPKGDITSPSVPVRSYGVAAAAMGHGEPSLAARRVKDQPTYTARCWAANSAAVFGSAGS